jgi:hypothetical protein
MIPVLQAGCFIDLVPAAAHCAMARLGWWISDPESTWADLFSQIRLDAK